MIRKMSVLQRLMLLKMASGGGSLTEYEATGNPISFNTNVAKPLKELLIQFTPAQAQGTPSPDNPLPITGRTGVNITRTGKNLLDPSKIDTTSANFIWYYKTEGFLFESGNTYTLSVGKDVSSIRIVNILDNSVVYAQNPVGNLRTATFTPSDNVMGAIRLWSSGLTAEGLDAQLELGSSASPYEEYVGTTIPVTFPEEAGTVYGGTLDLTTGVLTVDWKFGDLGGLEWSNVSSAGSLYSADDNYDAFASRDKAGDIVCDRVKTLSTDDFNNSVGVSGYFCSINSSKRFYLMSTDFVGKTTEEVVAMVTGWKYAIKIANTVTYQLDPVTIQTLIGDNVIFSDTNGENTVKYFKRG